MTYRPGLILLEAQHPLEHLDYAIPFGRWLAAGETIASVADVTIAVQPGLTLTPAGRPAPALTAQFALVFSLGGGVAGSTYEIEILAITSSSRRLVVSCSIEIVDPTPLVPV